MARFKRSTGAASAKGKKRPSKTMTTRSGARKKVKAARKATARKAKPAETRAELAGAAFSQGW